MAFSFVAAVKSLIPVAQKATIKEVKKKLVFHKLLDDLDIKLHDDSFDFIYLQTLVVFFEDKHEDWAIVFDQKECRQIFEDCFKNRDFDAFERLLDAHLHTTIKKGELKSLNQIPDGFVSGFRELFNELVVDNLKPSESLTINTIKDARDETKEQLTELKSMFQDYINGKSNAPGVVNANYEQLIIDTHQFQLDQIKKQINRGNMVSAQEQLIDLKEHIWPNASPEIKVKLLNNIAFTLFHQRKEEEALACYQEAVEIIPGHLRSVSQMVAIYLGKNQIDKAAKIAESLTDPNRSIEAEIQIYRNFSLDENIDPETGLSEEDLNESGVLIALINKSIRQYPDRTVGYARKLLEKEVDNPSYQEVFVYVICSIYVGENIDFNATELKSDADRQLIVEAAEMLDKLWAHFQDSDMKVHKVHLLEEKCLIEIVLGQFEKGLKTAELILSLDPQHNNAAKFKGFLNAYTHRFNEAIAQFESFPPDDEFIFDYAGVWALCLTQVGKNDEAFKLLNRCLNKKQVHPLDHERLRFMLQFIYRQAKRFEEALAVQETALKENAENIAMMADYAKTLGEYNRNTEALDVINRMVELVHDKEKSYTGKEQFLVADYLHKIGMHQEAAGILEKFVDVTRNHFLTYELIDCYVLSGRKGLALRILQDLGNRYGIHSDYTKKEADIYLYCHDYVAYEKLMAAYVVKYPDEFAARLNLNSVHIRLSQKDKTILFYENLPDTDLLSLMEIQVLAGQLNLSNRRGQAMDILYRYRRKNPGAGINDYYIRYCWERPNEAELYHLDTVSANAMVAVKAGDATHHYIIEDLPEKELIKPVREINLADPIYEALKGKKVGDRITGKPFFLGTTGEIISIQHKYMYAFQQAGEENGTIYASKAQIKAMHFSGLEDLHAMVQEGVKGQIPLQQAIVELEAQYKIGQMPIGVIGHLIKRHPIELYEYLVKSGVGIFCCNGLTTDYEVALSLTDTVQTFVFDLTSLLTLFEIAADLQWDQLGIRKIIANATFDRIKEFVHQRERESSGPHLTLFEENGKQYRQEVTLETKLENLEKWRRFANWVEMNFESLPCPSVLENEKPENEPFIGTVGTYVLESALLAKELDGIWVSDDAVSRTLISESYGANAVWTQVFLRRIFLTNQLTQQRYSLMIAQMCILRYQFTTINKDDILLALQEHNYVLNEATEACISVLSGLRSDDTSIRITFTVIFELSKLALPPKRLSMLIYYLLMITITYRCFIFTISIFRFFNDALTQAPAQRALINSLIRQLARDINPKPATVSAKI